MSSFNIGGDNTAFGPVDPIDPAIIPSVDSPSDINELIPDISEAIVVFDSSDPTSTLDTSDASFRISLIDSDPYALYTEAYFSVQESTSGMRVLYGWFRTFSGAVVNLIEIPLIDGMSLIELADQVTNVPGVVAHPINNYTLASASNLLRSGTFNATGQWAFFFSGGDETNSPDHEDVKTSINYYLTSVEPNMIQSNPDQSLGGHLSLTKVSETTFLSEAISFSDNRIKLDDTSLTSYDHIQIQDEIIEVESWNGSTAIVAKRNSFDTPLRVHFQGAKVKGLRKNDVFTSNFNENQAQYRCIAIKNDSSVQSAKKAEVYLKIPSRNNRSEWKISIEIPRSEYRDGTATSGTVLSLQSDIFANSFQDDLFITAPVVIVTGQNAGQFRIVTAYDNSTGTFSFDEELPFAPQSGDEFYVDTAPSQRISNGTVSPILESNTGPDIKAPHLISDFVDANGHLEGSSIDINGDRQMVQRFAQTLAPREVIYVWIERSLDSDNEGKENNRLALTLGFLKV